MVLVLSFSPKWRCKLSVVLIHREFMFTFWEHDRNKIEGTPILKLAMVKRLIKDYRCKKKIPKNWSHQIIRQKVSQKFHQKDSSKILPKNSSKFIKKFAEKFRKKFVGILTIETKQIKVTTNLRRSMVSYFHHFVRVILVLRNSTCPVSGRRV